MRALSSTPLAGPVIGPALECEIAPKKAVPWSLDENKTLLARVALRECQNRQGRPKWSQIAEGLPGRTPQEARCRWRRIREARDCVELGETRRNSCLTCGQLRRGHICPGVTPDADAAHQLVALREEGSASEEADIKHARPLKRHKTSQFRGVSIQSGQWTARIMHNGKHTTIGSFDTEAAYSPALALAPTLYIHNLSHNLIHNLTQPDPDGSNPNPDYRWPPRWPTTRRRGGVKEREPSSTSRGTAPEVRVQ